jgi:hypothetical protein
VSSPAFRGGPHIDPRWVIAVAMLCLLLTTLYRGWSGASAHSWNLRHVALGGVLAILLVASLSCGGSSSTGGGGGTTSAPPESGIVTVTGTSGSATRTATISVSVS